MATLSLTIETKDNSSGVIQNIGKTFLGLQKNIETAIRSVTNVGESFLKATGSVFVIVSAFKVVEKAINDVNSVMSKIGGDAQKSWEGMKETLNKIGQVISQLVMPVIVSLSKTFTSFFNSAKNIEFISQTIGTLAGAFETAKEVFLIFYNIIKNSVLKAVEDLSKNFQNTQTNTDNLTESMKVLKGVVVFLGVGMNVVINVIKTLIQSFIDLGMVVGEVGKLVGQFFTGQWDKLGDTFDNVKKKISDLGKNFANNIGDLIEDAKKTAQEIDKSFDVKKVAEKFKKAQKEVADSTLKTLTTNTKQIEAENQKVLDNNIVFTEQLKKQYEEYVKVKNEIANKGNLTEQQYFDKLAKLRELENIKGIKELEAYYSKQEQIVKDTSKKIGDIMKEANPLKYLVGGENPLSKLATGITQSFTALGSDIVNIVQGTGNKIQKVVQGIASGLQAIGDAVKSVMSYVTGVMEGELNKISLKYDKYFKDLEAKYNEDLKRIDEYTQAKLEALGLADKTELERAQEKLEELLALQQEGYDLETEQRLAMLEEYYGSLDEQTDKEIRAAYERQKAKILETEEKKKATLLEQIDLQQKEVKKLQILEEANKKKMQLEEEYNRAKMEAEKKRINEMNEKEKQIFEANKATQIANVWIATGVGVATAWATAMQLGPIAGPIAAGVLTALLLTNAGIQTGLIASQQYTPKNFATGGVIVGEAGRELVELPRGARVYNNDQTERMLDKELVIQNNIYLDSEKISETLMRKRINLGVRAL